MSDRARVIHGDCLDVLRTLAPGSVDAVCCDPPYALTANKKGGSGEASRNEASPAGRSRIGTGGGFMGQSWDSEIPGIETWSEVLRVAKPGAHLLAFGGTRTFHRLTCAIEDAGWEIRDCLCWLYGSGFPKSLNLDGEWKGWGTALKPAHEPVILARKPLSEQEELAILAPTTREALCTVVSSAKMGTPSSDLLLTSGLLSIASSLNGCLGALLDPRSRYTTATASALTTDLRILRSCLSRITHAFTTADLSATSGVASDASLAVGISRSVVAKCERLASTTAGELAIGRFADEATGPEESNLSPDWLPIILARKPLIGTVAANVAAHGTGALNIEACRIAGKPEMTRFDPAKHSHDGYRMSATGAETAASASLSGRWPANVVLDGDAAAMLDAQSGNLVSGEKQPGGIRQGRATDMGERMGERSGHFSGDSGGASRFFYCAKASRAEREAGLDGEAMVVLIGAEGHKINPMTGREVVDIPRRNHHPTVKPVDLMRWLVRLVTPPQGLALDPFMGSGTTGVACVLEGRRFLGIEREAAYVAIAERRIRDAEAQIPLGLEAA